ncbi:MAG: outer membrane protein assembly factor BamD [Myxococcota bacterium]
MLRAISILILTAVLACASTAHKGPKPIPGSVEALYQEAQKDQKDGLYPEALNGFADVKNKFPYSKYAALADLGTADTHFERAKYLEAVDAYRNFLKFYPNHPQGAYATLRIAEAYAKQIPEDWWFLPPSAEKDQANTRLAISAYQDMLARYPEGKLAERATKGLAAARTKLADHELYVANFYFERKKHKAAALRAEELLNTYPGLGHDAAALWIAGKSRLALGEAAAARVAFERLNKEFPKAPKSAEARKILRTLGSPPAPPESSGT